MPNEPHVQPSAAAKTASASRAGASVELIVLHNSYQPAGEALAQYAAPGATSAPTLSHCSRRHDHAAGSRGAGCPAQRHDILEQALAQH